MKAILFSIILFMAACTKQYEQPVKTDDVYHGYPIEMLQTNPQGNYRVTTYIGNNTYMVYVNVDKSKVTIVIRPGTAYFYRLYQNGTYQDKYIIEMPANYSITPFIN